MVKRAWTNGISFLPPIANAATWNILKITLYWNITYIGHYRKRWEQRYSVLELIILPLYTMARMTSDFTLTAGTLAPIQIQLVIA